MKTKLLFIINQFFKGGAETALLNLFRALSQEKYEIDFLVFDHINLPGAITLLPEVPKWIRVMNPAKQEGIISLLKKAGFRLYRSVSKRQAFRGSVLDCLKDKRYDVVISFGEWFSSRLAAEYVQARRKYVWIHADLDKARFIHPDILKYQQCFDCFLFASERSMRGAEEEYPELCGRGVVVHNIVNEKTIRDLSLMPPIEYEIPTNLPILVTIANLRPEKNHLRQIRIMKKLKERDVRCIWLNAGNLSNPVLTAQVRSAIEEAGLSNSFRLLGAVDNPYPLMKRAAAICVLSDHESWSMVITEAKSLGVPVIATRTSGALEQLIDMETGVLCEFSDEDIAERIESFLAHPEQGERIRRNLEGFSAQANTLECLEPLFQDDKKKVAYIFDNVNYLSGARNAALAQMEYISSFAEVLLFSAEPCQDEILKTRFRTLDLSDNKGLRCLSVPCREVFYNSEYSFKWKFFRLVYSLSTRLGREQFLPQVLLKQSLPPLLSGCDSVCVVSEASRLRFAVSILKGPKKVQWIHTDYVAWRDLSTWTKAVTKHDADLYSRYDTIVCLSEELRKKFIALYPHLKETTVVIPNFIQTKQIRELAAKRANISVSPEIYNLITIGRMEPEKRYDLVLKTAAELKALGLLFHWYLVGDGRLRGLLMRSAIELGVEKQVIFTGMLDSPYPLLKHCDVLVLLSDYEGTPVIIDEAKVLGVPILARDVGGVKEQLENGEYGKILPEMNSVAKQLQEFLEKGCGVSSSRMTFDDRQGSIRKRLMEIFN